MPLALLLSLPLRAAAPVALPPAVAELTWLIGTWQSEITSESWAAVGDRLLGFGCGSGDGSDFELMEVEAAYDTLFLLARPLGAAPTRFSLASSAYREARFEAPEHDFPQVVHYARTRDKRLEAGIGPLEGPDAMSFKWKLVEGEAPTALVEAEALLQARLASSGASTWVPTFESSGMVSFGEEGPIAFDPTVAARLGAAAWTPSLALVCPGGNLGFTAGTGMTQVAVWRRRADGSWSILYLAR